MSNRKSEIWELKEAAAIGYLMRRVGEEVTVARLSADVPALADEVSASMVLAQLTHEGRLEWDGKRLVSVDRPGRSVPRR